MGFDLWNPTFVNRFKEASAVPQSQSGLVIKPLALPLGRGTAFEKELKS